MLLNISRPLTTNGTWLHLDETGAHIILNETGPLTTNRTSLHLDETRAHLLQVLFWLATVFGVLANSAMLFTVSRMNRSIFHIIVTGLCISDIISACNSPLYIIPSIQSLKRTNFSLPVAQCVATLTVDQATSIATIYHVLLLSVIRYRGVVHSVTARNEISTETCFRLVVSVWLAALVLSTPFLFLFEIVERNDGLTICGINQEHRSLRLLFASLSATIGMLLPTLLIIGFNTAVIIFIIKPDASAATRAQNATRRQNDQQAVRQVRAVVVSFLIGYSVNYGAMLYSITSLQDSSSHQIMAVLMLLCHAILRVTECLNPFLYCFGSSEIRDTAEKIWKDLGAKFWRSENGDCAQRSNAT